jgi:hypothetical protein
VDRRALIVGSWLAQGRDRPSPQKVRSITDRWAKVFAEDAYGFRALTNPDAAPEPLHNPKSSELLTQFEDAAGLTSDTELLVYFLGHSVSDGATDLKLILGIGPEGLDRTISLSWLLNTIRQQTEIQKLVVILDTCHAGRTREVLRVDGFNVFAMFATGDTYAFDANFSDGLLRTLEQSVQKSDQRIDRRAGGITYKKVFEHARRRVLLAPEKGGGGQDPRCFGDYETAVLLPVEVSVPTSYNSFASSRSIYARMFRLLGIIKELGPTDAELREAIDREDIFVLRKDDGNGNARALSTERLDDYLDFLRRVRWLAQPKGRFQLTNEGQGALEDLFFNRLLLDAIEEHILGENVTFAFLDSVVKELLDDMIPPTPARIKERAAMKGVVLNLNGSTRLGLQLLPSTGKFLKGSADAIYPSEYVG